MTDAPDPILDWMGDYIGRTGRAPTKAEIREAVDFTRQYPIDRMLSALERIGRNTVKRQAQSASVTPLRGSTP